MRRVEGKGLKGGKERGKRGDTHFVDFLMDFQMAEEVEK